MGLVKIYPSYVCAWDFIPFSFLKEFGVSKLNIESDRFKYVSYVY